jgi:exosortase family protein XrtF
MNWKENLPALKFLGLFLGCYFVGNIIYGLFIQYNYPLADGMTKWVADQSSWLMNGWLGGKTISIVSTSEPIVGILEGGKTILRVYEGCNGINVMIVFVAFIVAFGGLTKKGLVYTLASLIIIYLANLMRITLLFWVAANHQSYFYYVHKYVFTATLYVIVLALWWLWVAVILKRKES